MKKEKFTAIVRDSRRNCIYI